MDEYKRMIFAVLLAALFIYLWTSFVAEAPRREAAGPAADSTAAADTTLRQARPSPGAVRPEGGEARAAAAGRGGRRPRGEWAAEAGWDSTSVGTGLCEATITAVGGALGSWRLGEFLDREDRPVDLVRAGPEGPNDLHVELMAGQDRVDLSGAPFDLEELRPQGQGVAQVLRLTAADSAGASVSKTYTFYYDKFYFDLEVSASGFPTEEGISCALSWKNGLPVTETNEKADLTSFAAMSMVGEEFFKDKLSGFKKEPVKVHEGNVIWAGVRNKYFMVAMIPTHAKGRVVRTWGSPDEHLVAAQVRTPMRVVADGEAEAAFRIYAGPVDYDLLIEVDRDLGERLHLEKDVYERFRFMAPLNHLIYRLMKWTYGIVPNYGIVIILVSALFKVLFYPLTKSSLRSMQAMKKVQPELEALKKKYKGDPKKMNQAQMELFKKHKVNPLGGCLPLLLQMPIFFALYNVLVGSVELRRAPFVAWIDDLSAPDTLFHIGTFPVHVLPLVMAVTQVAQPTMGAADARQQTMKYMMPIIMLVIFYGLPSGLVLYWTVNNVMTAIQQYMMNRGEGTDAGRVEEVPTPPTGRKRKRKRS